MIGTIFASVDAAQTTPRRPFRQSWKWNYVFKQSLRSGVSMQPTWSVPSL